MGNNTNDRRHLQPLSCSQKNIWNLEQTHPSLPLNNVCTSLRIDGNFNVDLLQKCIRIAYESFPTLRTKITVSEGKVWQYVDDMVTEAAPFLDFSKTNQSGVYNWYSSVAKEHFVIEDSPLCQMIIFKLSENSGGILTRIHHIITDAWSHTLVTNQIIHNYFQFLQQKEPDLEIRPDYSIHVEAEEKYLNSRSAERDRVYWRKQLKDIFPALVKEHQYAQVSPVGLRRSHRVSNRLNRMMAAFCKQNKVSPFAVFYMVLAIYLGRIKGQQSFCIGVPTINRLNYKEKNMGGMFVNTLPFPNQLDMSKSLREFNEQLKEDWFGLLYHQRLPFEEIKRLLTENGSEIPDQLFEIVLSYQNGKMNHLRGAKVTLEGRWLFSGYQAEALCIHLSSRDEENRFLVDYDYLTQIFSEQDIDSVHCHLMNILRVSLTHQDTPIAELPILTEEEEEHLIFDFNQTDTWYPRERTIREQLREVAELYGNRVAVIYENRRTTYGTLMQKSKKLGEHIAAALDGHGEVVALLMKRSDELFTALCAVIWSQNTWLLLDCSLPEARLSELLLESGAALCIADEEFVELQCHVPIKRADELLKMPGIELPKPDPLVLAYLVYTSGSTGKPKAVEVEQRSVLNLAGIMEPIYPKGAVLSICNVSFDAFLLESIAALLNGRTIVVASEEESIKPRELGRMIKSYDAGFMALTPSRLMTYLKEAAFYDAMSQMETIVCGGESLPSELYQTLRFCTLATLYNQYGPSEATVAVSHAAVSGSEMITIGKPLNNCRIYILDEYMNPMPVGAAGELFIGGECLAKGYRNAQELTEEKFVEDPFIPGERIYRTGDIGQWNDQGEIIFLGRKDSQLKLLGHRVEPGEVEARLLSHPQVKGAAVRAYGSQLIAYYTADFELAEEELLLYVSNYLPRYLIPVMAIQIQEMPVTASGKIDCSRLPEPVFPDDSEAPADELEEKLLSIWRKVLGNENIGIHSDYFLSGGDSLNAVTMLSEVERQFSKMPDLQAIYANSTVRRFGNLLRGSRANSESSDNMIFKAPERETYPLSASQRSFYILQQFDGTKISYNMPGAFLLSEPIDIERLEEAFRQMIEDDEMLRTGFEISGTELLSRVHEHVEFKIERMEYDSVGEAAAYFIRPFDLAVPPLVRAQVMTDAQQRQYLFLDMHHIISDGISSKLYFERLNKYYNGENVTLPKFTYRDYAWWMNSAAKEQINRQKDYWKKLLCEGVPELPLPADRPRKSVFDGRGKRYQVEVLPKLGQRIRKFCDTHQVTPYMLLISAYAVMLSRFARFDTVTIGSPVSGRRHSEFKDVTGVFVNTVPVILKPKGEKICKAFLEEVKDTVLQMLNNQEVPFEEMAAMAGAQRTRDKNPLFQVLFSLMPVDKDGFALGSAGLKMVQIDGQAVKMDLHLEVLESGDEYRFQIEYAQSLFDEVTIAFYSRCYMTLLQEIMEGEEKPLSELKLLSEADNIDLMESPNYVRTPYDATFIDRMIDRVSVRKPEQTAIRWGEGKSCTYRHIRKRSDQLALFLKREGVENGDRVAFMPKRDEEMLITMAGILKAGGVYLPIDPAFPKERVEYMIENAGARILLTGRKIAAPEGLRCKVLQIPEHTEGTFEPVGRRRPEDVMNVIYTSGSTGRPKGVMMRHKSISNLLCHLDELLGGEDDVILCASNCVFDVFTTETILAMGLGRCISVADEEEMMLPWKMAARMERDHATILQLTPSRMLMCLNDESFCRVLSQVKIIILMGEPWTMELKEQLKALTQAKIFNIYGPTETSVHNCQGDIREENSIHIGKPIGNCRYYLLDKERKLVPPTATGEIYIAGECLAEGYISQPELTDQVFVTDILYPDEKMYKTGDIGRMRADGNWQCLGRVDTQLKLNGHRIEPAEIAACMLRSGFVKEAAVVPVIKDGIPQSLKAFAVAEESFDKKKLLDYLKAQLPDYMVPSAVCQLKEMPRTASGKTDLNCLKALDVGEQVKEEKETKAQELLSSIWKEVLDKEPKQDVSFFEQGGTSLTAIVILSQYYKHHLEFSLNDFYQFPTLEEQADRLFAKDSPEQPKKTAEGETIPRYVPQMKGKPEQRKVVMLTGATGYLGVHLLKELLEQTEAKVICLVRGDASARMKEVLNWYFGQEFNALYTSRIIPVSGEVTRECLGLDTAMYKELARQTDMIIHSAADVRHYAVEKELLTANVGGTKEMIAFAKLADAAFMHISTVSVAGEYVVQAPDLNVYYSEEDLNIGQNWMENGYAKSKTIAEAKVAEAMQEGLRARIFRVGRLVSRSQDGVFQKNQETNAFYRILQGMKELGKISEEFKKIPVEVTQADLCAKAIIALTDTTGGAFHMMNPKLTTLGELAQACGVTEVVDNTVFEEFLRNKAAFGGSQFVQAVAEACFTKTAFISRVHMVSEKTVKSLREHGFEWEKPDPQMVVRCLKKLS